MQIHVIVHDVYGRLLRRRPAAVNPRVASETLVVGDQVVVALLIELVVFVHQPARPRIRPIVEQVPADVLVRRVLVQADVRVRLVTEIEGDVRFLLGERLVEGFARLLFRGRGAESDRARPPVRDDDPAVQRIVAGSAIKGVE